MTHRRAQMAGLEVRARAAARLSVRAGEGDGVMAVVASGYACVTGEPYAMYDWWGDEYTEVVDVGAFEGVLGRSPDVRLLVNHDGIPLARTTAGTLDLAEHTSGSPTGLWHEARMDAASPLVQQIRSAMGRGDLAEMSFQFRARAQWSPDWSQRNIREITDLYDVAYVTFPANPGTSAQLNGRLPGRPDDLTGEDLRAAHARLSARLARDAAPSRSLSTYRRKLTVMKGG